MPNKSLKVNIRLRAKDPSGQWRFLTPVNKEGKRNPLSPYYALVGEQPKLCGEGVYYLRYIEDRKPKFVKVVDELKNAGRTPDQNPTAVESLNQALAAHTICERRLSAKAVGLEIVSDPAKKDVPVSGHALKASATKYLKFAKDNLAWVTFRAYNTAVSGFTEHCKNGNMESVTEDDILAFGRLLKKNGSAPRTVANRVKSLKTFWIHFDVLWPVKPKNMPKFTKRIATAYDAAQVLQLAEAATLDEAEWAAFMVGTGVRKKEAMHACYTDFNFANRTFRVMEKKRFPKYKIKGHEERSIPINDDLIAAMQARQKRYPGSLLIFPTAKGKPEEHMLRILKRMALKGKLNCGHCEGKDENSGEILSCLEHPVCSKWTLHDFRRTYATMLAATGAGIDEIRINLGHKDIATTQRYLAAVNVYNEKTWKAVNAALPGLLEIIKTKS